jgi:hypothetical protein
MDVHERASPDGTISTRSYRPLLKEILLLLLQKQAENDELLSSRNAALVGRARWLPVSEYRAGLSKKKGPRVEGL